MINNPIDRTSDGVSREGCASFVCPRFIVECSKIKTGPSSWPNVRNIGHTPNTSTLSTGIYGTYSALQH